jgi:hypothetical protein
MESNQMPAIAHAVDRLEVRPPQPRILAGIDEPGNPVQNTLRVEEIICKG